MPTPIAHALAGTAVYLSASRKPPRREDRWLFATAIVAACFADLDFGLNFLTGENYHHYFTHSLVFSSLFALAAYFFSRLSQRPAPLRDAGECAYAVVVVLQIYVIGIWAFESESDPPVAGYPYGPSAHSLPGEFVEM